jgi:1-deoxy-D-xylulose-5-phosphate reductoisomerase
MRKVAILGSTGSIGTSGLKVIRHLPEELSVHSLVAGGNIDLLEEQVREFQPKVVSVFDPLKAKELQKRLPGVRVVSGVEGSIEAATEADVDIVLCGIVGNAGLLPTIEAIKARKKIALANKEVLVSAGHLVMALAKEYEVPILPVDSEHSALFQCLKGEEVSSVRRLILTASGGPFREKTAEDLAKIELQDALKHPTWAMGAKVTIDCSTLMNKGLEMLEARWLFDIPAEQIDVLVHPQSIIHSLVEYQDHSILAQLGEPSMITPIQYALTYPKRLPSPLKSLDLAAISRLDFYEPAYDKFKCLALARESMKEEGTLPCYMNAANEILVERFLNKKISWLDIGNKLETLMLKHQNVQNPDLETILAVDAQARIEAKTI